MALDMLATPRDDCELIGFQRARDFLMPNRRFFLHSGHTRKAPTEGMVSRSGSIIIDDEEGFLTRISEFFRSFRPALAHGGRLARLTR